MLDLFVAADMAEISELGLTPRFGLGGAAYWFLHRYFVHASLQPGDLSFLDLYHDTFIGGYQLDRLKAELELASLHLSALGDTIRVLFSWSEPVSLETEIWRETDQAEVKQTIAQLMELITEAQAGGRYLIALGD